MLKRVRIKKVLCPFGWGQGTEEIILIFNSDEVELECSISPEFLGRSQLCWDCPNFISTKQGPHRCGALVLQKGLPLCLGGRLSKLSQKALITGNSIYILNFQVTLFGNMMGPCLVNFADIEEPALL